MERASQLQIRLGKSGNFHLVLQQADLQRLISVNRDDDAFPMSFLGENMMAAVDALKLPSMVL